MKRNEAIALGEECLRVARMGDAFRLASATEAQAYFMLASLLPEDEDDLPEIHVEDTSPQRTLDIAICSNRLTDHNDIVYVCQRALGHEGAHTGGGMSWAYPHETAFITGDLADEAPAQQGLKNQCRTKNNEGVQCIKDLRHTGVHEWEDIDNDEVACGSAYIFPDSGGRRCTLSRGHAGVHSDGPWEWARAIACHARFISHDTETWATCALRHHHEGPHTSVDGAM